MVTVPWQKPVNPASMLLACVDGVMLLLWCCCCGVVAVVLLLWCCCCGVVAVVLLLCSFTVFLFCTVTRLLCLSDFTDNPSSHGNCTHAPDAFPAVRWPVCQSQVRVPPILIRCQANGPCCRDKC